MTGAASSKNSSPRSWFPASTTERLLWGFGALTIVCICTAIATRFYLLVGVPVVIILGFLAITDLKKVWWLALFFIPLSREIEVGGGLSTDLPVEPLMLATTGLFIIFALAKRPLFPIEFWRHPITVALLLHLGWILITTITSGSFLISFKWILAKGWYVITYFFAAAYFLKSSKDYKTLFWVLLLPILTACSVAFVRHGLTGFAFDQVNFVMFPFFRNHVNYACIMALFLPFCWFARSWYPNRWWVRWFINLSMLFLLAAVYFSYTRAAYVAILGAVGVYWIVRFKLMRPTLVLTSIVAVLGVTYLVWNNRYLDLAPNYETTVTHTNFDNLVEATFQGEDVSTMERVYRWVAGGHMVTDRPLFGFGPGNFHTFYKTYAVSSFYTYVSDNPEQSGIHSYYLMTWVEQGLPGLLLFLGLTFVILLYGQRLYHRCTNDFDRGMVMSALLSIFIIDALLIINDLLEAAKIGTFWLLGMAILVTIGRKYPTRAVPTSSK